MSLRSYFTLVHDAIITKVLQHTSLCGRQLFKRIILSELKTTKHEQEVEDIYGIHTQLKLSDVKILLFLNILTCSAISKYWSNKVQTCALTSCNRNEKPNWVMTGSAECLFDC